MNTNVKTRIVHQEEWAELAAQNLRTERSKLAKNCTAGNVKIGRIAKDETAQAEISVGACEKCGRNTFFTVQVVDRRARWCGCE